MRKLLLLLAVATMFFACKPEGYKISGKLINGAGETIFLNKIVENNIETVDSIKVDENGYFSIVGKNTEPEIFFLKTGNEDIILIVDSLDQIEIEADKNDISGTCEIKGSEASSQYQVFNNKYKSTLDALKVLDEEFMKYQGSESIDSIKFVLDKRFEELMASQKEFNIEFIEKNSNSLVSLFAIHQVFGRYPVINPEDDMKYYELLDSTLTKQYPNSSLVKDFHNSVEKIKNQIEAMKVSMGIVNVGDVAPEISLNTPEGKLITLSSFKGKYVLVDFWAAWCKPCRMENPTLVKAYNDFNSKGFEILQVSLDKTKEDWVTAIEADGLNKWTHVSSIQYFNCPYAKKYGVNAIPTNYLIDPYGKVVAKNLRGLDLNSKLNELIK